jgi:CubicO group peptidase (beta-lactamase class C family)
MMRKARTLLLMCAVGLVAACTSTDTGSSSSSQATTAASAGDPTGTAPRGTVASTNPALAETVDEVIRENIDKRHLRSVIVKVTIDGEEILTRAYGESMTGVPATTDMHFRNGAVAISYVSTLLLMLVDEGKVTLDDKVSTWLPDLPHADEVTLGQLAQMTSGYDDYVIGNTEMNLALYANPFRQWTTDELLAYSVTKPLWYPPGTGWNYAHTNYVILGLALEKITGKPMAEVLEEKVLGPMGLTNTSGNEGTPAIPEPALHAFTSERKPALNIPDSTGFYEESTFWNPSWTITHGAIQTTDIFDLDTTAIAIGTGKLLSPESYQKMISTGLRGTGQKITGCATCAEQSEQYSYGMGIVTTGNWVMQDPLFSGQAGAFAYLPSQKVAISLALTVTEEAFAPDGSYTPETTSNAADAVWREIGAVLVPDDAPPPKK